MKNAKMNTIKDCQRLRAETERADLPQEEKEKLIQTYYNAEAIATIREGLLPEQRDKKAINSIFKYEFERNKCVKDGHAFITWCMASAFMWGRIVGIRQERKRRKT